MIRDAVVTQERRRAMTAAGRSYSRIRKTGTPTGEAGLVGSDGAAMVQAGSATEVLHTAGRETADAPAVAGRKIVAGREAMAGCGIIMSPHRSTTVMSATIVAAAKAATSTEVTTSTVAATPTMPAPASSAVPQGPRNTNQTQQGDTRRRRPKYSQTGTHDSPFVISSPGPRLRLYPDLFG